MHPFGGTPICPRCSKAVYAAEQVMGPGRKLYHKPCLACTSCNKRLDSFTLLEHDQEPYCKNCHVKTFGTRDLRQANLPHRDDLASPPPLPVSPVRNTFQTAPSTNSTPARGLTANLTGATSPVRSNFPAPISRGRANGSVDLTSRPLGADGSRSPVRAHFTGTGPILRANSALPARYTRSPANPTAELSTPDTQAGTEEGDTAEEDEVHDMVDDSISFEGNITNTERVGDIQLPRTVPLSPSKSASGIPKTNGGANPASVERPASPLKPNSTGLGPGFGGTATGISPLKQTATGTRYGAAFGSPGASPGKTWGLGGATPVCPRCDKNVYFAEQMKAVGKTWHKGCLRCTSCNTLLDSKRLNEKDGDPLCGRCYSKLHGPQGSGYALLGKAGG
ncbi:hypothetical protein HYDPIDRAFT_117164 [Hydnomerulius pinastri MD-312]|uniref:Cysteine-rich protein 1 n=1 Tax=Hydnomerulius pinastri MD-312 TaxID=994086 RepID=A0A0C9V4L5_9AGAM|nr:hypothetical protein HYDPIDRAFT_117164 [Hydnomerulius pinastri MD-312]